jgi:hypothetical protein
MALFWDYTLRNTNMTSLQHDTNYTTSPDLQSWSTDGCGRYRQIILYEHVVMCKGAFHPFPLELVKMPKPKDFILDLPAASLKHLTD